MGTWIEILNCLEKIFDWTTVVPYVGTWIEIRPSMYLSMMHPVVPYVGTWIEIKLKLTSCVVFKVVPYVGTWIEIQHPSSS